MFPGRGARKPARMACSLAQMRAAGRRWPGRRPYRGIVVIAVATYTEDTD